jgi:hypothetical protein
VPPLLVAYLFFPITHTITQKATKPKQNKNKCAQNTTKAKHGFCKMAGLALKSRVVFQKGIKYRVL